VVDRFHNLAAEHELRRAATVHHTDDDETATILERLACIERDFRVKAQGVIAGSTP
jgi:hypothetical protein